jgi:SHS2 domain-containing protein
MPYEFIEHQADIGIQASGRSLSDALCDGVRGMLELMVPRTDVKPAQTIQISASGVDQGALFVDLLNAVLAAKDIHGLFFHDIQNLRLQESDTNLTATADLIGEPFDLERHAVDADVKAATYGGLRVVHDEHGWRLRCILDL